MTRCLVTGRELLTRTDKAGDQRRPPNMKLAVPLILVVLVLTGVYLAYREPTGQFATPYDWMGVLPANCQQLIKQGEAAYYAKTASAEQVFKALELQCGEGGKLGWQSGPAKPAPANTPNP